MVDFPAPAAPVVGAVSSRVGLSRRSLLTAGAAGMAGLVGSGCTANNPVSDDKTPKTPAKLSPDVAVATRALAEIRTVRLAVAGTASRFPATRSQLTPLVQMHEAHEASLADAVPNQAGVPGSSAGPTPYAVPRTRDAALGKLAVRERKLHDTLDGLALRAQSGDFARLLASMGAAVNQRLAGVQS